MVNCTTQPGKQLTSTPISPAVTLASSFLLFPAFTCVTFFPIFWLVVSFLATFTVCNELEGFPCFCCLLWLLLDVWFLCLFCFFSSLAAFLSSFLDLKQYNTLLSTQSSIHCVSLWKHYICGQSVALP